jgi:hypothetical protein
MLSKTSKRRFVWLGIASLVLWLVNTFGLMVLHHLKGGLPQPNTPTVSLQLYQSIVARYDGFVFGDAPAIAAGYLIIGLLIFGFIEQAKKDEEKRDDDA